MSHGALSIETFLSLTRGCLLPLIASVSLRRLGKRRHGQRGGSGESQDADKAVRGRHQEPVERPGDPGMLHSEEGVPALRLGQVVSVNRAVHARKEPSFEGSSLLP